MVKVLVSLLVLAGCGAAPTQPAVDSGCPPGQTRIDDENAGTYDCAKQEEYEDFLDALERRD